MDTRFSRWFVVGLMLIIVACLVGCREADPPLRVLHEHADFDLRFEAPPELPWTSGELAMGVPFHEALASWNIDLGPEGSARLEVRVQKDGEWSPWMLIARENDSADPVRSSDLGRIDVDYFTTPDPVDAVQARVTGEDIELHRVHLVLTNRAEGDGVLEVSRDEDIVPSPIELDVPFRSQRTQREELSGRLCSPTSLTMVLASHGVEHPVQRVADTAYDDEFDIYGNWVRNVQAARTLGAGGVLTRVRDWRHAEEILQTGTPIIASLSAREGELRGAPYDSTGGHLIVIRGFDDNGDILVSDPAAGTPETGMLTYRRSDMTRLWLGRTRGTAYVISPRDESITP